MYRSMRLAAFSKYPVIARVLAAMLLAFLAAPLFPTSALATPTLVSTASRKVHGAAGTFDLPLNNTPVDPTTEPRQSSTATVVFTFESTVTAGTASVTEGVATAGTPTFSGSNLVVPLTGVTDIQYVTVAVSGVSTSGNGTGGSGSVRLGFLVGDVNQNRVVTVADVGLINAQLSQPVTSANYLLDVNASGAITSSDVGITNAALSHALPPPGAGVVPPIPLALKRFAPASVGIGQASQLTITLNPKLLYVPNKTGNSVSVVNSADLSVVATISGLLSSPYYVAAAPYGAVTPYGGKVFVTHFDSAVSTTRSRSPIQAGSAGGQSGAGRPQRPAEPSLLHFLVRSGPPSR